MISTGSLYRNLEEKSLWLERHNNQRQQGIGWDFKKWLLSYQTSVTGNSAADVVEKYCLLATVSYYSTRVSVSLFQTVVMLCEV